MNKNEKLLFERFKFFGKKHLEYRQKCIGMLPEIYRAKIHEKKGFHSIFEFAAKFAGLSHEQVKRVLSLDERFEDKPVLKSMLENGEASISKLARVASVATAQNQEFWAAQIKLLPNRALETLVRDEKCAIKTSTGSANKNGLRKAIFDQNFVHVHKTPGHNESECLNLSKETVQKLLELQNKGINIDEIILEALQKRQLEIAQEKEQIATEVHEQDSGKGENPSRYIPAKIKKILKKEYGRKCSIPNCTKPFEQIHHSQRFSLARSHDPHYLAPLCGEHHKIAHTIDVSYQEIRGQALS